LSTVPGTVTDVAAAARAKASRGVARARRLQPGVGVTALVATVMLVTIASGLWAWRTARVMEQRMATMVSENVPSVVAAAELQAALLQQRGLVAAYMLDGGRLAWVNDLDKLKPELLRRLDAAQRSARTEEERTLLTQLTNVYAQYDAERERAIALYHDGHREAARDLLLGDVSLLSDQAQRLCRDLVSANRRFMSASLERGRQQLTWLAFLLPALIGVTTLLCLGVLVIVSRRLLRPVRQLARDARTFSTEDSARAGTPFNDDVHELEYYSRAIMSDATRVRADLEDQQRRLLNAEKLAAVGKFAACAAHELRNPLGAMKLWLHELKHTGAASAAVMQTCTVLEEEVLRLEELATSFLQHSKPPQLKLCAHDLHSIVDGTLEVGRHRLEEKRIRLVRENGVPLPTVMADANQIRQVLLNLIANAADATPEGGEVRISETCERGPDGVEEVVLRVSDTGPGVPEAIREHLFEPFVTTKPRGTGLGLCVAAGIVSRHGGRLELETKEAPGAVFALRLPTGLS
jgi:signal transduction histidine kinase